jgi:putative acetyltransferase
MVTVRPERPEDFDAARAVNERAFGDGSLEGALVDALRAEAAHVPELCLVALDGEEVVGHIFFSRARLASGHEVLALAPMAVAPERQRAGVGSRLVEASLRRAADTQYPLVVVLGHPGYYPRFGFEPAGGYGVEAPWDVPPEAWMVFPLPAYDAKARGVVAYPEAFDRVA